MSIIFNTLYPSIQRALFTLAALAACSAAWANDKHIDVTVENQGSTSKLVFDNSECPDRPNERGCVLAEKGTSPMISWQLQGDNAGAWRLTRLQMSPDGVHWGHPNFPLADCTVADFRLSASDRATGNASTAQIVGNGNMLQIRDWNDNECETHYRLYAEPVGGGAPIDSDPTIRNKGK